MSVVDFVSLELYPDEVFAYENPVPTGASKKIMLAT